MTDRPVSRRTFLAGSAAAGVAGAGLAGAAGCAREDSGAEGGPSRSELLQDSRVDFDGEHQAGIATPHPSFLKMVAFDLRKDRETRRDVARLMRVWTEDARRLCSGVAPRADLARELDTVTANLTITVGYGPGLFEKLGMSDQAPEWLAPLPKYSRDKLDDEWSGGDLALQICADDPMMVAHAARFLTAAGRTYVAPRWTQDGFLHAHGAIPSGYTMRNHFGQLDGTGNPGVADFGDVVWIDNGPEWLRGGTAMVVRRIEMHLDTWDILDRRRVRP